MSTASRQEHSAEERAEEVVARVTGDVSRFLTRAYGRAREEIEDILAEGRARYEEPHIQD